MLGFTDISKSFDGGAEVYAYNSRSKTNARQIIATFKQLFIMAMLAALLISPSMARSQTIVGFSPTSGPEAGGTVVTIYGTDFNIQTSVYFDGAPAQVTFVSDTEITVVSPPLQAYYTADIYVTNGGSLIRANGQFTYDMPGPGGLSPGSGNVGTFYSAPTEMPSRGSGPFTYALTWGLLPAGLALDPNTGVISGTPTATGNSFFTVTIYNGSSAMEAFIYYLHIEAATAAPLALTPGDSALNPGIVGTNYQFIPLVDGGDRLEPYVFHVTGSLPLGLSLDQHTGVIAGNPSESGDFAFSLTVTNDNASVTSDYTLRIDPGVTLTLTPPAGALTTPAVVGRPYSVNFTTTGGTGDYNYSATGLPFEFTMASDGTVSGIPATSGSISFTVSVSDSSNPPVTTSGLYTISVSAVQSTPATELSAESEVINQIITADAGRSLTSVIFTNLRMTREARYRLVEDQAEDQMGSAANASVSDVPVQIDGAFDATTTTLSSKGTFFGQSGLSDGTRRLVFGDFDVQHDSETGSSTATLNGKVAWEQSVSDKTLLGYFIGGELARSNIAGSFDGDQNRIGVSAGGYGVHEIAQQVYVEGFFSLGAGRNNLTMSNGVLDLDSDYTTRSATMGAALSGVIEQQGFEIWPELSLSYGRTWIGDVGFTGAAHSLVDNTLSLDAGTVTLANILFRPEFRVPMDGLSGAQSLQVFTFAPRLSCEQVKTNVTEENCGAGAELGFSGSSVDGLSSVSAKIMADRLGDRTTSSVQLNLQHRF